MPLDYKFQPLDGFPRELLPSWKREQSQFGKTWAQVQEILERELRFLKYRTGSVVLMTAHSAYDVRKDGKLRSDVRAPEHPGVVLKFDVYDATAKKYVQMSFECDKFRQWKDNVRAIADAMEALRKVDRYGVTGGGKADAHYAGYKALPDGTTSGAANEFADAAFIASHSGNYKAEDILNSALVRKNAYREAAVKLHPDNKLTGDHNGFVRLQEAFNRLNR